MAGWRLFEIVRRNLHGDRGGLEWITIAAPGIANGPKEEAQPITP
jgi:hypothetical protein